MTRIVIFKQLQYIQLDISNTSQFSFSLKVCHTTSIGVSDLSLCYLRFFTRNTCSIKDTVLHSSIIMVDQMSFFLGCYVQGFTSLNYEKQYCTHMYSATCIIKQFLMHVHQPITISPTAEEWIATIILK